MSDTTTSEAHEATYGGREPQFARDEKMATIEIDCMPDMQAISGGILLLRGLNRATVLVKDLKKIEAQVQTAEEQAAWEFAVKQAERDKAHFIEEGLQGFEPGTEDYRLRLDELRGTYPGSPEATYRRLNYADMKPFRSMRVIETGLTNPTDLERLENEKANAAALANAMVQASAALPKTAPSVKS